jgi:hypothetical protein
MTIKKAIGILHNQKGKIDDPNFVNDKTLVFQTASYIKEFFGEDSPEYKFISRFNFAVLASDDISNEDLQYMFTEKEKQIKIFLDNCAETLNHKGLFKQPKQNFLSSFSNVELYSFLITIGTILVTVGLFFGNIYSDRQNIELRQDKKKLQDSLIILRKLEFIHKIASDSTNKTIKKTIRNNNQN